MMTLVTRNEEKKLGDVLAPLSACWRLFLECSDNLHHKNRQNSDSNLLSMTTNSIPSEHQQWHATVNTFFTFPTSVISTLYLGRILFASQIEIILEKNMKILTSLKCVG
jgi:hypothetical protein